MGENNRILWRSLSLIVSLALLYLYRTINPTLTPLKESLFYAVVTYTISYGLIPLFYKLALLLQITDDPGGRHIHKKVTPTIGGLAIFLGFFIGLNLITTPSREFQGLFWSALLICFIGVLDDIKPYSAGLKLIGQLAACLVLIYHGIIFSFLPNTAWGYIISATLTIVWVLGITNAFNCLDGLDGLAASIALVVTLFFTIVALMGLKYYMALVSIILFGAILGFFPYNFRYKNNALIFLGDTGSTFIGFTIAALAIYGTWGEHKSVDLTIPVILLAVPITDMTLTSIVRIYRKEVHNVYEFLKYAGKDHLHHRILASGLSSKAVVSVLTLLTIIMGLLSILIVKGTLFESLVALIIGVTIFVLITSFLIYIEKNG